MPNIPTTPNTGRGQILGLGAQTEKGTAVAPTLFLPITGGSDLKPTYKYVEPDFADGNVFSAVPQLMAVDFQGHNKQFYASPTNLEWLIKRMLVLEAGDLVAATGIITPQAFKNWHRLMPLPAVTIEDNHPTTKYRITDGQIFRIELTISPDDFVATQIDFHGIKPEKFADIAGFVPTLGPVEASSNFYNIRHFRLQYNGVTVPVKSAKLIIEIPIEPQKEYDGTNNLYIGGFERNGNIMCSVEFTLFASNAALDAAAETTADSAVTAPLEFKLGKGTNVFKVNGTAHIEKNTADAGLGVKETTYTAVYRSVDNATSPFTVGITPVP